MAMDQRHADTTSTWEPIDLTQADVCNDLAQLINDCEAREPLILRTLTGEDLPGLFTRKGSCGGVLLAGRKLSDSSVFSTSMAPSTLMCASL